MVWWLGIYASASGSMGSIPLGATRSRIPHSAATKKKKERERERKKPSVPVTLLDLKKKKKNKKNLSLLLPTMGLSFLICTMGRFEEWGQVRGRRLLHPNSLKNLPDLLPTISLLILLPQPNQAFVVTMGPMQHTEDLNSHRA